jgi:micrococcal nuclease
MTFRLLALSSLLLLLGAPGCAVATDSNSTGPEIRFTEPLHVRVAYAVDGDTLRVRLASGELAYVRLVGIDTPEDVRPGYPTECGAEAAAASMERLAPEGAAVTLRPDSVADAEDRYGRILAHAFIAGRQLEIAQLRRGLAFVYRFDDQRFDGLPRFKAAQRSARNAGRGTWSRCDGDFHSAEDGVQH